LQFGARRLWLRRGESGGDTERAAKIGARACKGGADALWPALTDA